MLQFILCCIVSIIFYSCSTSEDLKITSNIVSISVTPTNQSLHLGTIQQFNATGIYSNNTTKDLTASVIWSTATTSVANISNALGSNGMVTPVAQGSTVIMATDSTTNVSGTTTLTVTPAALVSIAVTQTNPSIANGTTKQFTALGTYTDNSTQDITTSVTWNSSSNSVASVSNVLGSTGLATAAGTGSATITAIDPATNVSGNATLTITPATLLSISVTPTNPSIINGMTAQFIAIGTYSDNSTQNLTTSVTWDSSSTSVASISNASGLSGLATAAGAGSTKITATSGSSSVSNSTTLTVSAAVQVVDSSMTGTTAPGWTMAGIAQLTGGVQDPVGSGWLRLTSNSKNQEGSAYFNTAFDISQGAIIQFDFTSWGGTGADGYSVYLFDAATTNFSLGALGGSLAYAQNTSSAGLSNGYVGVGIDEYGNYSNSSEGRVGGLVSGSTLVPNAIGVRGPASSSYEWLGGTGSLSMSTEPLWFNQGSRPSQTGSMYRKAVIYFTPVPAPNYVRVDVYIQFGAGNPLTQVISGLMVGSAPPPTVKIGVTASTGGSTNYHEIRNVSVSNAQ